MSRVKKESQSGRTLLEMLGVLALMGALSIGAFQLWGTSISKLHADNLLDEARIRVVMGAKNGGRIWKSTTYASDQSFKERNAGVTSYGYGIAKDATELVMTKGLGESSTVSVDIDGTSTEQVVIMVPVGRFDRGEDSNGKKIGQGVCEALLKSVYHYDKKKGMPSHGDLMAVCEDRICNDKIVRCGPENEDDNSFELPDKIYLAIKK